MVRIISSLLATSFLFTIAIAQTNRGGITGTVFDKNGAVIPGASVRVTNVGTNRSQTITTSSDGAYTVPSLEPVVYRITAEAPGFRKSVVGNIKVDTAVTSTINITLETGTIDSVIEVTADGAVLNAESGTPGQTISERQITDIPLNNRSVLDLVMTVANVTGDPGTEDPGLSSGDIPAPGFNVNVNGGRAGSMAILADGANNSGVGLGRAVVTFSPDTVQEFTVQTSNYSAEYGKTGGGIVNMTTKSGTNQYKGLAYWYHRNPTLNAAPWTMSDVNRPVSNRRQHQFGLTFGGPVQLPKKIFGPLGYDGHDRTFFFTAIEPRYYYDGTQGNTLLPTDAMRRGDFSNTVRLNNYGYAPRDVAERFGLQSQIQDATIYNHFNLAGNQFLQAATPYAAFPNNVIPQNMMDPLTNSLLQYIPTGGDYYMANGQLANYVTRSFIKDFEKRVTVRIDHQATEKNRVSLRYTSVPIRGDRGSGNFELGKNEITSQGTDYSWSKQILFSDTHVFSPRVFNELRLNYTYGRFTRNLPPEFDANNGRNLSTELGLPSLTKGGLPNFSVAVANVFLGYSQSQQNENAEHSYEIADNVSVVKGAMTFKMGVNLMQQRLKTIPMFGAPGGNYQFGRNRTLTNSNGGANGIGGNEFAQFLLGTTNSIDLRDVLIPYYYQWNSVGAFFQNDWKVRPNLTLNLGLRYSLSLPRTEKYDRQGLFLLDQTKEFPLATPITLADGTVVTKALVPPYAFAGKGGRSRYIFPAEYLDFEPRFGFAWSPNIFGLNKDRNNFVLRGGYGLNHAPLTGTSRGASPDFGSSTLSYGTFDQRVQFPNQLSVIRLGYNKPVINQLTPDAYLNIPEDGLVYFNSIRYGGFGAALSPNAHIPYVQSWSLSASYELDRATVLELSYSGSKGTHLFLAPKDLDQLPNGLLDAYLASGQDPLGVNVSDPLGRTLANGNPVPTFDPVYLGATYLGFQGLTEAYDASANSIRHGGSISLRRQMSRGLSYTANYTFAKSMDDASDSGSVRFVDFNIRSSGHVNYGAPRSIDRSVSLFDIKHAFNSTFIYDLPVGRGRSFLSNTPGILDKVLGGWSLSGNARIQGGVPMVVVLRDSNGLGLLGNTRNVRPDLVPGVPLKNPRWDPACPIGSTCEPYYNPAAFMRPVKGTLGNAPRSFDNARTPLTHFFDLSMQKSFYLDKEKKRSIQFRVDAINVLNHPIFRVGRGGEDVGEIFAAPTEASLNDAEYDAWARAMPGRPARTTPAGQAALAQIQGFIQANRIAPNSTTNFALRPDFFHVPVPEGFFSMAATSFDITTLEGYKLYRLRNAYTPDRWGFLEINSGRGGYSPRFLQFAIKFYF
jgi:carboxypeptidase family protein